MCQRFEKEERVEDEGLLSRLYFLDAFDLRW